MQLESANVVSLKFASKTRCHPERRLARFCAKRSRKPALSEAEGDLQFGT
jgi:hypothetical protein